MSIKAQERLVRIGRNELPVETDRPGWYLFLLQFRSPLMYIMMLATAISGVMRNWTEAVFIFIVMCSNAVVGYYQEHKANQSLKALRSVIRQRARVVRDGLEREVDVADLVPGDVLVLRMGDKVPADCRILECKEFKTNEASLTGESRGVKR